MKRRRLLIEITDPTDASFPEITSRVMTALSKIGLESIEIRGYSDREVKLLTKERDEARASASELQIELENMRQKS